jgi:hypothetical protein
MESFLASHGPTTAPHVVVATFCAEVAARGSLWTLHQVAMSFPLGLGMASTVCHSGPRENA